MNDYELVTILNPEIADENLTETIDRIHQFITNRGGEIQNVDQWGRRRLAYPIARQAEGTYVVTLLRLNPANAAELEANLRISEVVLRHLLVRNSPAEAAAALQASQRRRPRPREEQQESAPAESSVTGGNAPSAQVQAEAPAAVGVTPAGEVGAPVPQPEAIAALPETEPAPLEPAPADAEAHPTSQE